MVVEDNSLEPELAQVPESLLLQAHAAAFPPALIPKLYEKLTSQTFDAGEAFKINYYPTEGYKVVSTEALTTESDVFLVDHALEYVDPIDQDGLAAYPDLLKRLAKLMSILSPDLDIPFREKVDRVSTDVRRDKPNGDSLVSQLLRYAGNPPISEMETLKMLDLTEAEITDDWLDKAPVAKLFPVVERLHLEGNKLEDINTVVRAASGMTRLKAIWVDDNPFCKNESFSELATKLPSTVEIVNSKFTSNYTAWALELICGGETPNVMNLCNLDLPKVNVASMNEFVTPSLHTLDLRGNPQLVQGDWEPVAKKIRDEKIEVEVVLIDDDRSLKDFSEMFATARKINSMPRWIAQYGVSMNDSEAADLLKQKVVEGLPQFTMKYQMAKQDSPDERISVNYVLDEFGSYISHSSQANFRLANFFFGGQAVSVLWPCKRVAFGDTVTRDFADGIDDPNARKECLEQFGIVE